MGGPPKCTVTHGSLSSIHTHRGHTHAGTHAGRGSENHQNTCSDTFPNTHISPQIPKDWAYLFPRHPDLTPMPRHRQTWRPLPAHPAALKHFLLSLLPPLLGHFCWPGGDRAGTWPGALRASCELPPIAGLPPALWARGWQFG